MEWKRSRRRKRGITVVDYILMVVLVVMVAGIAITNLTSEMTNEVNDLRAAFDGSTTTTMGD